MFIFLHSNINRRKTNDVSSLSHDIVLPRLPDTNDRRHLTIHRSSPSERDACHTTHHAVACLPIHRVALPVTYPIPTVVSSAYDTSRRIAYRLNNTARPDLLFLCATCCAVDNTINNMVERACGCVPCVACKRMFKGRGLSLHATRTGCGNRWFQMDGTTYDARWNEMMQTLPCKCAMK